MVFGLPIGLVGGSMSLSAWYVLRSVPADTTGSVRAATMVILSAVVSSALWATIAQLWWRLLGGLGLDLGDAYRPGVFALLLSLGLAGYLAAAAAYQVGQSFEATSKASRARGPAGFRCGS